MRQWTIDAFAAAPFMGNPACVVEPFDEWPAARWMQNLARENNQADTAFLRRRGPDEYDLRWFTPTVEVPMCGHATLAAAHAVIAELGEAAGPVVFQSAWGRLTVNGSAAFYEMDLPADLPRRLAQAPGLSEALGGVEPLEVWSAAYLVAVLQDEASVITVAPTLSKVAALSKTLSGRGHLVVTAKADDKPYHVVSRFFAPGIGIPEDPTTGSAHCILAPLWSARLNQPKLTYFQAFPGRGGSIVAEFRGDRVTLGGQAITVMESVLRV